MCIRDRVDFILHSVNHLLEHEFGQTLGCKNVHLSLIHIAFG